MYQVSHVFPASARSYNETTSPYYEKLVLFFILNLSYCEIYLPLALMKIFRLEKHRIIIRNKKFTTLCLANFILDFETFFF